MALIRWIARPHPDYRDNVRLRLLEASVPSDFWLYLYGASAGSTIHGWSFHRYVGAPKVHVDSESVFLDVSGIPYVPRREVVSVAREPHERLVMAFRSLNQAYRVWQESDRDRRAARTWYHEPHDPQVGNALEEEFFRRAPCTEDGAIIKTS